MDDFFGDVSGHTGNSGRYVTPSTNIMKTDIRESENDYEISIDLPGYRKEDVQAELKDGYLVINAKNESKTENTGKQGYIRRERYYGACSRSFYVGEAVRQEDISARFENGVLIMNVPKHVEKPVEEKKYISID